jgi:hypothetical protein
MCAVQIEIASCLFANDAVATNTKVFGLILGSLVSRIGFACIVKQTAVNLPKYSINAGISIYDTRRRLRNENLGRHPTLP